MTHHEKDILRKLTLGMTNKQMAEELGISVSTVKYHMANLFHKLNVQNRTNAVVQAKERKLI